MIGLSPWNLIFVLGIPLIIIAVIGFALAMVIRSVSGGRRLGNSAVHAELVRIDERLTSIEKVLRDIELIALACQGVLSGSAPRLTAHD